MQKTGLRAAPAVVGVIASIVAFASGPALAASIKKCTTIGKPGSYELTRNLTARGDCLVVAANFVTIDLSGWVITGDGSTGSGVTDQGNPRQGIAVRNGTITGFAVGVGLGSTGGPVVEKVRASDIEVTGIGASGGSAVSGNIVSGLLANNGIIAGRNSIISGNVASNSGNVAISGGDGSIVSDNVVTTSDFGISAGSRSTVSGNNVGALDGGIFVGPGSTVSGNTAHFADEGSGINISVTCPSNVIGNTVTGDLVLNGAGCTNIDNLVASP
jgi:hypothetical protein